MTDHEHPFFRGPAEPVRLEPGQRIRIAGRIGTFISYRSAWPNLIGWLPDGTLETESIQWSCGGVVLSETLMRPSSRSIRSGSGPLCLEELLGIDLTDPVHRMARDIVQADARMWDDLAAAKEARGLTTEDVAELMGISVGAVRRIEGERDCYLSTLRRYRLAVLAP